MFGTKFVKSFTSAVICAFAFIGFTQSTYAVVLDFEALALDNSSNNIHGNSYSEDGFTINETGIRQLNYFGLQDRRFVKSTSLFSNTVGGILSLTKDGGGAFSLFSIDLNELNEDGAVSVNFTGTTAGGGTIMQTFSLDGIKSTFQTFFFNLAFSDVTEVTWIQDDFPYHQFDNITLDVSAVPLPAAMPLYATGLMAFGFATYRRRKRKNNI